MRKQTKPTMDSLDIKRVLQLGMLLAFFLLLSAAGCTYYIEGVLPAQMADRGMCWSPVLGTTSHAYQPCVATKTTP